MPYDAWIIDQVVTYHDMQLLVENLKKYVYLSVCHFSSFLVLHTFNPLFEWSQKWGMDLNILKCYIMSFNISMNPIVFNYAMNGVPMKRINTVCDLGITITNLI